MLSMSVICISVGDPPLFLRLSALAPCKKGPAPGSCFYKFSLLAPAPSKKARLLGSVFREFYLLWLPLKWFTGSLYFFAGSDSL